MSRDLYELCHSLFDYEEMLKEVLNIMSDDQCDIALTYAPASKARRKLLSLMTNERAVSILANTDSHIRLSVTDRYPSSVKDRIIGEITQRQSNSYTHGKNWIGHPTQNFIEQLGVDLRVCARCHDPVEDGHCLYIHDNSSYHSGCYQGSKDPSLLQVRVGLPGC
jgi:hypothetical protein